MNVLVIGSGAREHAIAWKLAQSTKVNKIFAAPGNPGIGQFAELHPILVTEIEKIISLAKEKSIDLVVVGPEVPLALGIADRLKEENILCFGPTKQGALLESSKRFSKEFMKKYQIPTAHFESFSNMEAAKKYILSLNKFPIVIKADGLAQGKGVIIALSLEEAITAIELMLEEKCFGDAGNEIVVEEFLEGEEVSLLTFFDGETLIPMLPVQDHKRIGEGDTGLNTGGMGAYAPVSIYTELIKKEVEEKILIPTKNGIVNDQIDYKGCLYVGLILTNDGPKVIEYNARWGDPETEVLIPLLDSDLFEVFHRCASGNLKNYEIKWKNQYSLCVIVASEGYPENYQSGYPISNLDNLEKQSTLVFQAGTKQNDKNEIVTSGGRVLAVVGIGDTFQLAKERAYLAVEKIHFQGAYFRRDIGYREKEYYFR
jgi:phosphoribosylamine--glycine ligase